MQERTPSAIAHSEEAVSSGISRELMTLNVSKNRRTSSVLASGIFADSAPSCCVPSRVVRRLEDVIENVEAPATSSLKNNVSSLPFSADSTITYSPSRIVPLPEAWRIKVASGAGTQAEVNGTGVDDGIAKVGVGLIVATEVSRDEIGVAMEEMMDLTGPSPVDG